MDTPHEDAEDYIAPHEEGHEHDLGHLEEAPSVEAEEYVGPLDAEAAALTEDRDAEQGDPADETVQQAADHMKAWFHKKEEEQRLL